MTTASANTEATLLTPTALINLFELDMTPIGNPVQFYFVDGTNTNYQSIVFGGQTYMPFPVQITDFGYDGQGGVVRPKLSVSNIGGFVSNLLLQNQDLVGATVSWTRVFARFIDAVNFPKGVSPYTPDPTAAYAPEIYFINTKTKENPATVQWELGTSFELDSRKLPNRVCLAGFCQWRYREIGTCGYSGPPVADVNNNLFTGPPYNYSALNPRGLWLPSNTYAQQDYVTIFSTNQALLKVPLVFVCVANGTSGQANSPLIPGSTVWVQDACAKTLLGCKIRYPFPAVLPFGAYPGLTRSPWVAGNSTTNA